ncbi:MAG: GAF domain-containing sensor histidine kinase [Polyangiales bacterium]
MTMPTFGNALETRRLEALRRYAVLDTPPEASFDRIARLAAAACDCPIALISVVDKQRVFFKAAFNFGSREMLRSESFCSHAIESGESFVVEDASIDPRFETNPHVTMAPNIRFYAGVSVKARTGEPLGTLCVIDQCARQLTDEQSKALSALAKEVEQQLELRRLLTDALRSNDGRVELASLAVHDLRSPLSSVLLMSRWLLNHPKLVPELANAAAEIESAAQAAIRIARNVLDVMRGERGLLTPVLLPCSIETLLENVSLYARREAAATGHFVETRFAVGGREALLDPDLVHRILCNLVDNAVKFAPIGTVVEIDADVIDERLRVRVRDHGTPISPDQRANIFEPGVRLAAGNDVGSGLGLRFCRLASDALGARIFLDETTVDGNMFVLYLSPMQPVDPSARADGDPARSEGNATSRPPA